jgi:hypothetical protein
MNDHRLVSVVVPATLSAYGPGRACFIGSEQMTNSTCSVILPAPAFESSNREMSDAMHIGAYAKDHARNIKCATMG